MDALNVQISGDADGNARLMLGILDCLPTVNQVTFTSYSALVTTSSDSTATRPRFACDARLSTKAVVTTTVDIGLHAVRFPFDAILRPFDCRSTTNRI